MEVSKVMGHPPSIQVIRLRVSKAMLTTPMVSAAGFTPPKCRMTWCISQILWDIYFFLFMVHLRYPAQI
jgi:hypothetical protein